ncbi:RBBP9/YdeN family alpha/beta hydrolase [Streptomyces sp. LaPpAH-108]|uniref:RBBP9/YdeN family alpha/beta hydrolase n=1 Tax=Streptomyces sp. LaPpAH-108 TaxID=1155714 RepID=UPI00035C2FC0|nr:alpha/beta hydrolase [Streptomyces sp. LaPpAH-108]
MRTPTRPRATIIHGYCATPEDHWFPWLAARLDEHGVPTAIPALPDTDHPDPDRWTTAAGAAIGTPDADTTVVAHSLGCLTVLRHLSTLRGDWRLGTLVLVSGFVDPLPAIPELDAYIADGCDPTPLAARIDHLTILRSDADPLVPTSHTDHLATLLGTTAQVIPGAGHFMADEGITTLPEALSACRPGRA